MYGSGFEWKYVNIVNDNVDLIELGWHFENIYIGYALDTELHSTCDCVTRVKCGFAALELYMFVF